MRIVRKRVSVITPFHNIDPEIFRKTAQSLLAAANDDWEWIVVLHNTDNVTEAEIRSLVGNDRLLSVYEKKDNRHTPSSPRNLGLLKAKGEYIYFLDGDDLLDPDFISEAIRRMETDGADIGIGRVKIVHQDNQVMHVPLPLAFPFEEGGYTVNNDKEERGNLLYGAPMMLGSKLIRRSLIMDNAICFDEEIVLTEDVIFMLECCTKADKIRIYKDLVAYSYIQREGSLLQNMIMRDDSSEEVYLKPLRRIVSLCIENNFSPGAYLWNMFGLYGSIYQNERIDKEKRTRLMAGIQAYIPLLAKQPPEGIGQPGDEEKLISNYEEILNIAFSHCDEETFRKYFLRNVFKQPDHTCVEWRGQDNDTILSISYQEMAYKAAALAAALYEEDLAECTVAAAGEKSINWLILCVACFSFGISFLPIDQTYGSVEVAGRVGFSKAAAVFTDSDHRLKEVCHKDVREYFLEDIDELIARGEKRILNGDAFSEHDFRIYENDPALLLFTSGTGGRTKCAVLLEKNLTPERYLWTPIGMDRYPCLSMLPFCHIAGIKDVIGSLITGTSVFIGSGIRNLIADFLYVQPVCVTMVPVQAKFFAKLLEGSTAARAREILGNRIKMLRLVGAPVSDSIRDEFAQWDIEIHSNYGLSEACGTVSCSYMKDGKLYSKPGSVGHVIEGVDVKINNPDENGDGEILLCGQIVFAGYLNDQEATDKILSDGWLKTGDIGHMDEDRYLFIRGRKKNIILLSSGENIIPEEIEREIADIPYVRECIVYENDNILCARIVTEQEGNFELMKTEIEKGVNELNKRLPAAMCLQKVEISEIPLPRTISGKIKRNINA